MDHLPFRRKPEKAKCLRCGKMFMSQDKKCNRICPRCTHDNNRINNKPETKVNYGRPGYNE